jgi:hypothetical protein
MLMQSHVKPRRMRFASYSAILHIMKTAIKLCVTIYKDHTAARLQQKTTNQEHEI